MRKRKLFTGFVALATTVAMATSALAADTGTLYAGTDGISSWTNLNDNFAQTGKGETTDAGVVGLKPTSTDVEGSITFTVNVDTAGKYKITVGYSASGSRWFSYYVNGGTETIVEVTGAAWTDSNTKEIANISLAAGENTIKLASPSTYDNSTVKTPNIDFIKWELTEADVVVPPVDDSGSDEGGENQNSNNEATEPATDGGNSEVTTTEAGKVPQTGESTKALQWIILGMAAAVAGVAVRKQKKERIG